MNETNLQGTHIFALSLFVVEVVLAALGTVLILNGAIPLTIGFVAFYLLNFVWIILKAGDVSEALWYFGRKVFPRRA